MNDTPSPAPVPSLFAALELALNTLIDARVKEALQPLTEDFVKATHQYIELVTVQTETTARLNKLEAKSGEQLDTEGMVDITSDEFKEAVRNIANEVTDDLLEDHNRIYDHDEIGQAEAEQVRDIMNDLLAGATVEISV